LVYALETNHLLIKKNKKSSYQHTHICLLSIVSRLR